MTDRWERIQSLFLEALEHPEGERETFVVRACEPDAALAQEILAMLASHGDDSAIRMESWMAELESAGGQSESALLGTKIGPYRVEKLIGRGGMGEVYLAERDDDQFHQQVALKLLGTDLLSGEAARRFRVERQILARLNHPNIARLLDGGVTESGRPYIVMEYVAGVPVTEYCDRHGLSIHDRIRLFQEVCEAVGFAHQHLVVHRDIKASNVLVSESGEVKLLDFGIAKLLEPGTMGATAPLTRSELRVMTAECAAPEQVRREAITTATDVYALGLLLYQLLSGQRAYEVAGCGPTDLERIVCVELPSRPSLRVDSDGHRRRTLRGDLDNVVMMALRKEPARRYASAGQLSEDLGRYLGSHPVVARTDTLGYRVRRFVRRNRVGVGVASAFALLSLGSAGLAQWQARQVAGQRDLAERQAAKAEQVTDFLLDLFEAGAPTSAPRDTIRARDLLEVGRQRIEALAGQPVVQADMYGVLSRAYWRLGQTASALELAERSLETARTVHGETSETTANAHYWVGVLQQSEQSLDEAEESFQRAFDIYRARRGESDPVTLKTRYHMGLVLHMMRRSDEANEWLEGWDDSLLRTSGLDDEDLAVTLSALASYLQFSGRLEEAEAASRRAIDIRSHLYGPTDYRVGDDLNELAGILVSQHRPEESEAVARRALDIHRRVFPEGHFALGRSLDAVGEALVQQERYAEAEPYLEEALGVYRRTHGQDHPVVARGHALLAQLYRDWGRPDQAEDNFLKCIAIYADRFGPDFLMTIRRRAMLAEFYQDQKRFDEAEALLSHDYQTLVEQRGAEDRYTLAQRGRLDALREARAGESTPPTH